MNLILTLLPVMMGKVQNGADETGRLLTAVDIICVSVWLGAVIMIQIARGEADATGWEERQL
ncbi:hypothetical protein PV04_10836 [Phialophora macrospora]|uniref:Uncharacterized protein n=1 Tax=Phialophora macrospora TaxID=1851006 RepID=A0A0D2F453_9EURO|nr:hypothetical protein PV04_10836 [Phialophora macrospora]